MPVPVLGMGKHEEHPPKFKHSFSPKTRRVPCPHPQDALSISKRRLPCSVTFQCSDPGSMLDSLRDRPTMILTNVLCLKEEATHFANALLHFEPLVCSKLPCSVSRFLMATRLMPERTSACMPALVRCSRRSRATATCARSIVYLPARTGSPKPAKAFATAACWQSMPRRFTATVSALVRCPQSIAGLQAPDRA